MSMAMKDFMEALREELRFVLPKDILEDGRIKFTKRIKNNDISLHGIVIEKDGNHASPILYVEELYEMYKRGVSVRDIATGVKDEFCRNWYGIQDKKVIDPAFEKVKDMLTFQVVDMRLNQKRLAELKYRMTENSLAYTYYIELTPQMWIPVTRQLAEHAGYDMEKVHEVAIENSQRLHPAVMEDMLNVKESFFEDVPMAVNNLLDGGAKEGMSNMYILSNDIRHHGANVLFYPGMQELIGHTLGDDYYILPSSVHELIILPKSIGADSKYLAEIVKYANDHVVGREELLSYVVFQYDRERQEISIAESERNHGQRNRVDERGR